MSLPGKCSKAAVLVKKRTPACDVCKRKRVRCDGEPTSDNQCTNCVSLGFECTYKQPVKRRAKSYVKMLEKRLSDMESLLHSLRPDIDISQELDDSVNSGIGRHSSFQKASSLTDNMSHITTSPTRQSPSSFDEGGLEHSDDEIIARETVADCFRKLNINPALKGFQGKSSETMLLQSAIEAKYQYTGTEIPRRKIRIIREILKAERPTFPGSRTWNMPRIQAEIRPHSFPDVDLMFSLIGLYFSHFNDYLPLLHRPTFEKNIYAGLHFRDRGFGSTVLLVCAVGSRFSYDSRIFFADSDASHSRGWEWFRQVQFARNSFLSLPSLYEVQSYCLAAMYLSGTSAPPQARWTMVAVGIRLALNVGAHRRKVYNTRSTVEEELWRRAFWVLVYLDRVMAVALGRSCAIQNEDFDLEHSTECDDEYWVITDTQCQFNQPPQKPSKITYFNCLLRLNLILAFALRTIYSINKSRVLRFLGENWEQCIIAELDSALNKWIDSVPDHLRWDPSREIDLFLNQSASLYAHYYQLQIAVHRPFISSSRNTSDLSFSSLAICTNAARSCIHVLDMSVQRCATILHTNLVGLFTSGIVLLLNIWRGKKSGLSIDYNLEMMDVHKCMNILRLFEDRWCTAGRSWDVIHDLASVGDLPLPEPSSFPRKQKRRRGSEDSYLNNDPALSGPDIGPSVMSPPYQALSGPQPERSASEMSSRKETLNLNHPLPVYTEELGRLPLYPESSSDPSISGFNDVHPPPLRPHSSCGAPKPTTSIGGVDPELDAFLAAMMSMSPPMFNPATPNFGASLSSDISGASTLPADSTGTMDEFSFAFPEYDLLSMWSDPPQGFGWDVDWELVPIAADFR